MDDVYVYRVPMPGKIHEMVTPCEDGYTVYINDALDDASARAAYQHAVRHIRHHDFDADAQCVQEVEGKAHGEN